MRQYVISIWMLGHCLHFFLFISIDVIRAEATIADYFFSENIVYLIMGFPVYVCMALPSLLLSRYAMKKIMAGSVSEKKKFLQWLVAASLIVLLHAIVAVILIWDERYSIALAFTPALIATLLAVFLRRNAFDRLAHEHQHPVADQ